MRFCFTPSIQIRAQKCSRFSWLIFFPALTVGRFSSCWCKSRRRGVLCSCPHRRSFSQQEDHDNLDTRPRQLPCRPYCFCKGIFESEFLGWNLIFKLTGFKSGCWCGSEAEYVPRSCHPKTSNSEASSERLFGLKVIARVLWVQLLILYLIIKMYFYVLMVIIWLENRGVKVQWAEDNLSLKQFYCDCHIKHSKSSPYTVIVHARHLVIVC